MKMRTLLLSNEGFSLVGVAISAGLVGILALVLASTMDSANRAAKSSLQTSEFVQLDSSLKAALSDTNTCAASFYKVPVVGFGVTDPSKRRICASSYPEFDFRPTVRGFTDAQMSALNPTDRTVASVYPDTEPTNSMFLLKEDKRRIVGDLYIKDVCFEHVFATDQDTATLAEGARFAGQRVRVEVHAARIRSKSKSGELELGTVLQPIVYYLRATLQRTGEVRRPGSTSSNDTVPGFRVNSCSLEGGGIGDAALSNDGTIRNDVTHLVQNPVSFREVCETLMGGEMDFRLSRKAEISALPEMKVTVDSHTNYEYLTSAPPTDSSALATWANNRRNALLLLDAKYLECNTIKGNCGLLGGTYLADTRTCKVASVTNNTTVTNPDCGKRISNYFTHTDKTWFTCPKNSAGVQTKLGMVSDIGNGRNHGCQIDEANFRVLPWEGPANYGGQGCRIECYEETPCTGGGGGGGGPTELIYCAASSWGLPASAAGMPAIGWAAQITARPATAKCSSGKKLTSYSVDYLYGHATDWNDNQDKTWSVTADTTTDQSISCRVLVNDQAAAMGAVGFCQ